MNELHLAKLETVRTFKPITLLILLIFSTYSYAAVTPGPVASPIDLRKIKIKDVEKLAGKKLTLFQKIKFKILQKALGKWKGGEMTEKQKKQAKVSMILGIGSLVLLLLSAIPVLGFMAIFTIPAAILAIIFGAKSLKGNSNSKGIVGVVTGSITLILFILAIIVLVLVLTSWH